MTLPKKIGFSISTLLLAAGLLAGLEFAVGKVFPEVQPRFLSVVMYDQIDWYQINRGYLNGYFTGGTGFVPEFKPSLSRKRKTEKTFRILCIGESSMFGVPYQMTANIPGIVRRQLRHLCPDREIEVVNLGASAINTNVILDLTDEFLALEPDLVLLYTGHNEFYGPDGVGASWLEKTIPALTRWKYAARRLSLVRLIGSAGTPAVPAQGVDANLMKQVSNGALVALDSPEARTVFSNFERNLSEIILSYRRENIPVIVSDVTSNLRFAPFASDTTRDGADAQYLLGTASLAANDAGTALRLFEAARDNDLLKFRAPGRINTIIRSVCAQYAIPFFSSDSIFRRHSSLGIPDTSLFWEHLHPTSYGYYLIANGFVNMILHENILSPRPDVRLLPFDDDSLHVAWLDRAFADVSIKNLTSKWPFKNFSVVQQCYPYGAPALKATVDDVYALRKVWDEGCYETAQRFWSAGDIGRAITTYRAVIEEYPYNFYAHYLLANALSQSGRLEDATRHYGISIGSNPGYPHPKLELGLLLINQGKFDEAIGMLEAALEIARTEKLTTMQATIYYGLGTAYANKREFEKALSCAAEALVLHPNHPDALLLRRKILSLL